MEILLGIFWFLPHFTAMEAFEQYAMYLLCFAVQNCKHMICNDICHMQDISTRMVVRMVPTIIFTRQGKEVGRIKGVVSIQQLQEKITSLLQPQMTWELFFVG